MCGFLSILETEQSAGQSLHLATRGSELLDLLAHRGPDQRGIWRGKGAWLGHRRLSIMAPQGGLQPIYDGCAVWVSNSEIYNSDELIDQLGITPVCASDSKAIGPVLERFGVEGLARLDGQFAIVHVDAHSGHWIAGRDHMGICPMYIGWHENGTVWFASEMKALVHDCDRVELVEPGTAWVRDQKGVRCVRWYDPNWVRSASGLKGSPGQIRTLLTEAVAKRIRSDAPWGVLLSGGLDSSLVASIASRLHRQRTGKAIHTFSIGLDDSPDLLKAREVAHHIGSIHHEYRFTIEEAMAALPKVVEHLESDQQIRTGVPTYLLGQCVRDSGFKMVLSGEGADEVFGGYLYFHKAPSPEAFHDETVRKVTRLHQYDVMRANKAPMASGLELRFPLLDRALIDHAMNIDPRDRMIPREGMWSGVEKALLREAFRDGDWLPDSILHRQKEQFSDGVGYGWVDALQDRAAVHVSDEQ
ncbi:MAG TPA: asparagine synthase (glutamine-hydrolyzing), partial [Phycisphaerales bacterium]|nr:asparagine synthase (glutamine-hydrolyzing) [Phycisphaerales bacterium]